MIWSLIVVLAFATNGTTNYGGWGNGGLTAFTLDFNTKESCEAAGKDIWDHYKTHSNANADQDKEWMVNNLNIQYKCIPRKHLK